MDPSPQDPREEAFSGAQRMKAVDVMRLLAKRYRQKAAKWEALANSLESIEKYARERVQNDEEMGPHIGVGSPPEELLWELANDAMRSV